MRQSRAGDRGAFEQLVARYERPVLATALHVLDCPEDARDVAQDVFLIAWRKLGALWAPRRFGPWILRVTRNAALRHRKRRAQTCLGALPDTVLDRRPSVPAGDEVALLALVARLPEHEKVVVLLRYLDEMPVGQIARVLALPVGTVTKQLSRARERLRRQIKCEENPCGRIKPI